VDPNQLSSEQLSSEIRELSKEIERRRKPTTEALRRRI
jgi:hypothetical protein